MDSCSIRLCRQKKLTYVQQLRRDLKQRDQQKKREQAKFNKELNKLRRKRKNQQTAVNKAVKKLAPEDKRKFHVYETPSQVIIARNCDCRKRFLRLLRPWYCYAGFATAVALTMVLVTGPFTPVAYTPFISVFN